jgi:hypothetical protein
LIVSVVVCLVEAIRTFVSVVAWLHEIVMDRMIIIIANCEAEHKKKREESVEQIKQYKDEVNRLSNHCDDLTKQLTVLTSKVSYYEGLNARKKKRSHLFLHQLHSVILCWVQGLDALIPM